MDPFEKLPEEIYDELLKNFSTEELLHTLSFVSKKWYEIIGNSNVCMQNFLVNLVSRRKTDFDERVETLQWMSRKTARKYMHVQSNCLLDERVSKEFLNYLQSESTNHLVSLNVRSMKIDFELEEDLHLEKLEYLRVMFIPRKIVNKLLASGSNLRTVVLRNEDPLSYDDLNYLPSEETIEVVKKCLKSNPKLHELEVQGRANFYAFFHEDISGFMACPLRRLTVKIEMPPERLTEAQEDNLLKLLETQKQSLDYVYIDKCGPRVIKKIFNDMPKLNTIRLDFESQDVFDVATLNLSVNENITCFELAYVKPFDDLKKYLDLVPNVKEILISNMHPRLMEYASNILQQLESLVYRYDDCYGGCDAVYITLRHENPELKNKKIKLSMCNDFL